MINCYCGLWKSDSLINQLGWIWNISKYSYTEAVKTWIQERLSTLFKIDYDRKGMICCFGWQTNKNKFLLATLTGNKRQTIEIVPATSLFIFFSESTINEKEKYTKKKMQGSTAVYFSPWKICSQFYSPFQVVNSFCFDKTTARVCWRKMGHLRTTELRPWKEKKIYDLERPIYFFRQSFFPRQSHRTLLVCVDMKRKKKMLLILTGSVLVLESWLLTHSVN